MKMIPILMADDDPQDRMLAEEALKLARLANKLHWVEDGEALMDYLNRRPPYDDNDRFPVPGLILLDLNMPRMDGRTALKEIKSNPELRHIPVVVLTTSSEDEEVARAYDLGANSYICKPVGFDGLIKIMQNLGKYWFSIVELPDNETND